MPLKRVGNYEGGPRATIEEVVDLLDRAIGLLEIARHALEMIEPETARVAFNALLGAIEVEIDSAADDLYPHYLQGKRREAA